MDLANFLIQILNSVQYGLLLFLLAAGLTLIFGIMGVVNLAHGSFYMIGAYLGYGLTAQTGSLTLALMGGAAFSVLLGWVLERVLFRHFYHRDHLDQVLMTFGLIYVLEETRSIVWGDDVHGVPIPELLSGAIELTDNLSYPHYRLFISLLCLLLALGLYLLISKTRVGMRIRAGAFNSDMTEALGINIRRLHALVFALGVGLAAVAGERLRLRRLQQLRFSRPNRGGLALLRQIKAIGAQASPQRRLSSTELRRLLRHWPGPEQALNWEVLLVVGQR